VVQLAVELVLELAAPRAFAAAAGPGRVAALDHETWDDAVKLFGCWAWGAVW
jgi:hypothetical protein